MWRMFTLAKRGRKKSSGKSRSYNTKRKNAIDIDIAMVLCLILAILSFIILFGNKGAIGKVMNLTLAVKSKVDNEWLIGCIIKSSVEDRGIPFKQLLDWLEDYRVDNTVSAPTIAASYAAAGVLQKGNPMAYADVDWMMVGKDAETQYYPASMTKLMTAMVVLDYCKLDEKMTIKTSDIQGGSGPVYADGDTMTIYDAVLAMLLPSSNTLAVALSRFVGNKILNIKNK